LLADAGRMVDGANFNDSKKPLTSLLILAPWPRCGHDIAIISLEILAGGTSYFFTQWKDDLKFVSQNSDHFIMPTVKIHNLHLAKKVH
jgi:hypothetical protein